MGRRGATPMKGSGPCGLPVHPNARSDVRVSYVVSDAGWAPVYDAEVSENGGIQMKRYASVRQSTGRRLGGGAVGICRWQPAAVHCPAHH